MFVFLKVISLLEIQKFESCVRFTQDKVGTAQGSQITFQDSFYPAGW